MLLLHTTPPDFKAEQHRMRFIAGPGAYVYSAASLSVAWKDNDGRSQGSKEAAIIGKHLCSI